MVLRFVSIGVLVGSATLGLGRAGLADTGFKTEFFAEAVGEGGRITFEQESIPIVGKLYVGKRRIRIEIAEGEKQRVIIQDPQAGREWVLDASLNVFREKKWRPRIGIIPEGKSPCRDGALEGQGYGGSSWVCRKLGVEIEKGREAEKWQEVFTFEGRPEETYFWVDRALRIVVRLEGMRGKFEVLRIREGPQPPVLFEIPEGYVEW